ncbi:MAG: nucleotidyl transferase AbiEii/AbiGii toxin family protein [Saprospiraceae bacterium]|nr:nucleotidyl transferase AbiEii/AbiGii toxin family protein [Saprospiraceae bacterium]
MINIAMLNKIKRLTISALVADDILMGILVLKGGNALDLVYDITNRGSIDIDFSIEKDFTDQEKKRLLNQISHLLVTEFSKENLFPFDIHFSDKPHKINDNVKSFWGGYRLEFKVIDKNKCDSLNGDWESIRRNALPIHTDHSPIFTVDISKYEYIGNKRAKDLEGAVVYVYSPEMLALEKLRALCQQVPLYKEIIFSMTPRSRARDFFDIYNLTQSFSIDYKTSENIELSKHIFDAKRVPLNFISLIIEQKEFHRQSWESVINTVSKKEDLKDYEFYFDFVLNQLGHLAQTPLG